MTDLFNYTIIQNPDPLRVTAEISGISADKISGKISKVENFSLALHSNDTGILGAVESFIALVATLFANVPSTYVNKNVVGKEESFALGKPLGYSFTVEGQPITVQVKNSLELSDHQGMLLAAGDVEIA
ncbi:hypothetical protein AB0C61_04415 [Streptomyces sp. NPDC048680]|uniref:hypothetical protein n=1 Tax=Streptomyces sp. NPDC048680 TaxID=3155492 RepID=UPI003429B594